MYSLVGPTVSLLVPIAFRIGVIKIKQSATKVVDKLCSIGFVERITDANDRRIVQIRTTDIGKDYIDVIYCQDSVFIEAIHQSLDEEEMKEMNKAIETLIRLLPKL